MTHNALTFLNDGDLRGGIHLIYDSHNSVIQTPVISTWVLINMKLLWFRTLVF